MSESIILGVILALSGGCMDAYSYLCRGRVFANAQTGNMLLLGINLFEQNRAKALAYALPVLAFTIGIVFAEVIRYSFGSAADDMLIRRWPKYHRYLVEITQQNCQPNDVE